MRAQRRNRRCNRSWLELGSLAMAAALTTAGHARHAAAAVCSVGSPGDTPWIPDGVWLSVSMLLALHGVRSGGPGGRGTGQPGVLPARSRRPLFKLLAPGFGWWLVASGGALLGWIGVTAASTLLGPPIGTLRAHAPRGTGCLLVELLLGLVCCVSTTLGSAGFGGTVRTLVRRAARLSNPVSGSAAGCSDSAAARVHRLDRVGDGLATAVVTICPCARSWGSGGAAWLAAFPPVLPSVCRPSDGSWAGLVVSIAAMSLWYAAAAWPGLRERVRRDDSSTQGDRAAVGSVTPVVELRDLTKSYARRPVLQGISLVFGAGEVVGIVGKNGAGKTTLLAVACGLVRPDSGRVLLGGHDLSHSRRAALHVVGAKVGEPALFDELTTEEHLGYITTLDRRVGHHSETGAAGGSRTRVTPPGVLGRRFGLNTVMHQRAGLLSAGMRQRLALAVAWAHDPELLLLDEPFNGLDPEAASWLRSEIGRFRHGSRPGCVLISSHDLRELQDLCTRVVLIEDGRVLAQGTTEDVTRAAGLFCVVSVADLRTGSQVLKHLAASGARAALGRTDAQVLVTCLDRERPYDGDPCRSCPRRAGLNGLGDTQRRYLTLEELYLYSRSGAGETHRPGLQTGSRARNAP